VQHLVRDRGAQVIVTMDTGITANEEARWCREQGVEFVCTDHHKIQAERMPDCVILNPKIHPDPQYQELCGCGITFVLLRKLAVHFSVSSDLWTDLLALVGMATICDVVPLNGVNHRLAQQGIAALLRSKRPIFQQLLKASSVDGAHMDERDVGFRLGPRINAVGRLEHAHQVIAAFLEAKPDALIHHMGLCNERRKKIQAEIVVAACVQAQRYAEDPILFLGGEWHQGVVGIAASKVAEKFWKPVWLFDQDTCKGSARSIPGFDVTDAMGAAQELFQKFGGHRAAGGFTFKIGEEKALRRELNLHASQIRTENPNMWESVQRYDCALPLEFLTLELMDCLSEMRPFGHGFEEPRFLVDCEIAKTRFYCDKETGVAKHTAVEIKGKPLKIMFFNEVHPLLEKASRAQFLVTVSKNFWQGQMSLSLIGSDFSL
jgi:single-stranded-DNA-specific exonuclease